jgi:hypothetical protein
MAKANPLTAALAALASIGVLVVIATSARAATVTTTIFSINGSEPFYGGNCGFPLTATFSGEVRMRFIEMNDGSVQLIFTPVKPSTITVTNQVNGRSLTSLQVGGEILQISESSFVDHSGSAIWNFVVPGSGAVLQWVGYNNFVSGVFYGAFTQDTSAFCNYLSGV